MPYQALSLVINLQHVASLCSRLGCTWQVVTQAVGWVLGVSVLLTGALTYSIDGRSRAAFLHSRACRLHQQSLAAAGLAQGACKTKASGVRQAAHKPCCAAE